MDSNHSARSPASSPYSPIRPMMSEPAPPAFNRASTWDSTFRGHMDDGYSPNYYAQSVPQSLSQHYTREDKPMQVKVSVEISSLNERKFQQGELDEFDVQFMILLEQLWNLQGKIEFQEPNGMCKFSYVVKTDYYQGNRILNMSEHEIRKNLVYEIQNRTKHVPCFAHLVQDKYLDDLKVEVALHNSKQEHYSEPATTPSSYGHYNQRSAPSGVSYSRRGNFNNYDYGHSHSPAPHQRLNHGHGPHSPNFSSVPDSILMNARTKKKKNQTRMHSKNYRARQDLVQNRREAVMKLLGNRLIADDKNIYLRGSSVLFIPSKSPSSLTKIADFVKDIDDDPNVQILQAALPLSRKNEFQLKGFLAYLQMANEKQVEYVRTNIYAKKYQDYFQKCVAAEFKKSFKTDKPDTAKSAPVGAAPP